MRDSEIRKVIEIFQREHAAWVLVGAHAVGMLTRPRATANVDFIVDSAAIPRVIAALATEFGDLRSRDVGGAIELAALDVDIIHSANHPLFREAIDLARPHGDWQVPPAEVLIALKFLAAISPWRARDRKAQDMVDLRSIYLTVGAPQLDLPILHRLGGLAYPDADREFRTLIERLDRGEPIAI